MSIARRMTHTFTRHRRTALGGYGGGFSESDLAGIPCVAHVESAAERFRSQRESDLIRMTLYCVGDTDVRSDDCITYDGLRYRVLAVIDPVQNGHHLEVLVELEEGA